jgi:hypothetical protein
MRAAASALITQLWPGGLPVLWPQRMCSSSTAGPKAVGDHLCAHARVGDVSVGEGRVFGVRGALKLWHCRNQRGEMPKCHGCF